jgi:hypothetical protein
MVEEYFNTGSDEQDWEARYNVAPTQPVPVICQNAEKPVRALSLMRWGLIPSWAKDRSSAASMINARSETASIKPAFADALKHRRCLIPADGFYEWKRNGKSKQPFCFELNDGRTVRVRWPMGSLEGVQWELVGDLHDSDNNSEFDNLSRPRPYARDPRSRHVRSLARSGDEERRHCLRIPEAL